MAKSQNGWSASTNRNAIGVKGFTVNGVSFPNGVRGGDVTVVLQYVATRFADTVEALHKGWCWGYDYREIRGSRTLSNHASGTAIDFNAPDHPQGKRGTFTSAQVKAIRKILDFCEGVVRWGGDYSGTPDEMHFEIVGNASAVARVANKIRNQGKFKSSDWTGKLIMGLPTLKRGAKSDDVKTWQGVLNARGYSTKIDGDFGPKTEAGTRSLQKKYGAELIDGIVGPETWTIGLTRKDTR